MKTKFIFDLDGTLVKSDYEPERKYFHDLFGNDDFTNNIGKYLLKYETTHDKYDITKLSKFLTKESGYNLTENIIREWIYLISKLNNPIMEEATEVLEDLKYNNKQIILLTNWFLECQIERLKTGGLHDFFDEFYGGDILLKPNSEAFENAIGNTPKEECIMIGDSYNIDIIGANNAGIDALYFSKDENTIYKNRIKRLNEIRKWI